MSRTTIITSVILFLATPDGSFALQLSKAVAQPVSFLERSQVDPIELGATEYLRRSIATSDSVPEMVLHTGFFKSTKFSFDDVHEEKVHNFWGYYRPEFKEVIGTHPDALRKANAANLWTTAALVSWVIGDLILLNYLIDSQNSDFPLVPVAVWFGAAGFSRYQANSKLKNAVRVFNELQRSGAGLSADDPNGTVDGCSIVAPSSDDSFVRIANRLDRHVEVMYASQPRSGIVNTQSCGAFGVSADRSESLTLRECATGDFGPTGFPVACGTDGRERTVTVTLRQGEIERVTVDSDFFR